MERPSSPFFAKALTVLGLTERDLVPKTEDDVRAIVRDLDPDNTEQTLQKYLAIEGKRIASLLKRVEDMRSKLKSNAAEAKRLADQEAEVDASLAKLEAMQAVEQRKATQSGRDPKLGKAKVQDAPRAQSEYTGPRGKAQEAGLREAAVREIEDMVDHELNAQRIKEARVHRFEEKLAERKKELAKKLHTYEHVMSEHEKQALLGLYQKRLDRDVKEFEVEVNRRAHEYMQKLKAERLIEEDYRLRKMKEEKDMFKKKRELIKNSLLKDISSMRQGHITTEDLQSKYGFLHLDESLNDVFHAADRKHSASKIHSSLCSFRLRSSKGSATNTKAQ